MFQIEHLLMETMQHITHSHEEDLPANKEKFFFISPNIRCVQITNINKGLTYLSWIWNLFFNLFIKTASVT